MQRLLFVGPVFLFPAGLVGPRWGGVVLLGHRLLGVGADELFRFLRFDGGGGGRVAHVVGCPFRLALLAQLPGRFRLLLGLDVGVVEPCGVRAADGLDGLRSGPGVELCLPPLLALGRGALAGALLRARHRGEALAVCP